MDSQINPFSVLTFIVAPAILTNASSVMIMGTSNRFARAVDRVRALSSIVENQTTDDPEERDLRLRQLHVAERRTILLLRALTAFYLAVGSFAAAALISLLGAVFYIGGLETPRNIALVVALVAGILGVGGLKRSSRGISGSVEMPIYSAVRLTIQGRDCAIDVGEIDDSFPILIGQIPLESLDWVVDPARQRLIGNPEHGGEHIIDVF